MEQKRFIKEVEKLIDPITVGSLHFIQSFNRLLPKNIQKSLINSSSKKIPYMGFVVEPYAFFLCYEIKNLEAAQRLLPSGFHIIKTKIFTNDDPKYYGIISCFRSHTSAFWGTRAEFYIIAEDESTGLLSWIIVDYDSDTISYDKLNGLKSPNSSAIHTTDYAGNIYIDIENHSKKRRLECTANINTAKMEKLDQRLWLEGNLSIGYGRDLSNNQADIFSLKFDPREVSQALEVPLDQFNIEENSWYETILESKPSKLVCFPYAQHFISDSPGISSKLKNKDELVESINKIDFKTAKTFSAKSFTKSLMISGIISTTIIIILVILLILVVNLKYL